MSMSSAISKVMTSRLSKLGYPTDDIRWSLGYCQGDGASFTGKLDLKVLGARIIQDVHPDVWDEADLDLELTRSGHYVHERSTSLNYDLECITGSESDEFGGVAQKVALGKLIAVLQDEIVQVGGDMAADGYKVFESYIHEEKLHRTYRTENFAVEVWEVPDEFASPFDMCDDESDAEARIRQILAEEIYFGGIKVVIKQVDDDGDEIAELASANVCGCEWGRSDSVLSTGIVRELMSEAVVQARETFERLNRPKLKKAA